MKSKGKSCSALILLLVMLLIVACNNEQVDATVIILGHHANANTFHHESYKEAEEYIEKSADGGYIAIISSEGTPRVLRQYYNFEANISNRNIRREQKNENRDRVVNFIRSDTSSYATTPENDLLKAIQLANTELNIIERRAERDKKRIKEKTIVVMDAGIVTTGVLDFTKHNIDIFDFGVSNSVINEFASEIAENLSNSRELPDFKNVNIVFIGLGDVALPQKELSSNIKNGLKLIWTAILSRAGAGNVVVSPYTTTHKVHKANFPVKPIEFLGEGWQIDNKQVKFDFGRCNYRSPKEAEENLKSFADIVIRYINRKPDVKIYVVGSESKDQDREYTIALSGCRAKTVMETLVAIGVPRYNVEAFGLAVYLPGRDEDRPNNVFDPVIGERNQKVMIIPSDIGNQAFLREVLATKDKLYIK